MLHILLLILKIIGIILLVILGLILLIILTVLFVPVRYGGDTKFKRLEKSVVDVEHDDGVTEVSEKNFDLYALGTITWLLHLVNFTFRYSDGIGYRLKILGITFMSEGNLKKEKKKKKTEQDKTEQDNGIAAGKPSEAKKTKEDTPKTDTEDQNPVDTGLKAEGSGSKTAETGKTDIEITDKDKAEKDKTEKDITDKDKTDKDKAEKDKTDNDKAEKEKTDKDRSDIERPEKEETGTVENQKDETDKQETGKSDENGEEKESQKQSVVEKIKNIYNKTTALLDDRKIQKAYELVKVQLVRLLKAIAPRKLGGYAKYGFEDPSVTGYITAFLAAKYGSLYKLDIEPHFDEEVLDGELTFKGRIFIITLVCIACKVYFNKYFKYSLKKLKSYKEDVTG